jgi:hypothetical protein
VLVSNGLLEWSSWLAAEVYGETCGSDIRLISEVIVAMSTGLLNGHNASISEERVSSTLALMLSMFASSILSRCACWGCGNNFMVLKVAQCAVRV